MTGRPLNGAELIAALPVVNHAGEIKGHVVTVQYGTEIVVATVGSLSDPEWWNGRFFRGDGAPRQYVLARALLHAARRATEATERLDGVIIYNSKIRED